MDIAYLCGYRLLNLLNYNVSTNRSLSLAHKIHGGTSGTPVIIMHGLLGSKRNWESVSKNLASSLNRTVIAVDLRNHGESPHDLSHTYPELAADVVDLMNSLTLKTADVIGHSMGGRTAMVLALTQPSLVSRLVVVDISPVSSPGIMNGLFPKLMNVIKTIQFNDFNNVIMARNYAKDVINKSEIGDAGGKSILLTNIGMKPDKRIGWLCNFRALEQHFDDIATFPSTMKGKTYEGPTLFIGGQKSKFIPPEDLSGIQTYFPNAKLTYVPNVGHNVHAEDTTTFLSLVKTFLS